MRLFKFLSATGLIGAVTFFSSCGGGGGDPNSIVIKGSDTMLHLVKAWVVEYQEIAPGVSISVTGGGSGTGVAALLNGTTDICASSRDLKEEERELAAGKGLSFTEQAVAMDGIALVISPENPIGALSLDQIKGIYTGAITNWSEIGGPDELISVCSRESNSGTYVFFQEHVLEKENYTDQTLLLPATSAIIQTVQDSPWAIGYVGLGYAEAAGAKVKVVPVKTSADAEPVVPTTESVRSGAYSIARPLYYFTAPVQGEAVAGFIAYCLSEQGQAVVAEEGYVSVN